MIVKRQFLAGQRVMACNLQVWKHHVDMLREVGDTPLEELVESSNQTNPVEDVIFPTTISLESGQLLIVRINQYTTGSANC